MYDYDIYANQLAPLGHGYALWEPTPVNYAKVCVADVGYIRQGCFHRIFNAALPATDRANSWGVPRNFIPIILGVPSTLWRQPRVPRALHSSSVKQQGLDVSASPSAWLDAGTAVRFESTSNQGAILITKHETFREDALQRTSFNEYILQHHKYWVEFANQTLRRDVELEDLMIVTGYDVTSDFAMAAFSDSSLDMRIEFRAELPIAGSASCSVWGSWNTTMSVHHNCGPQRRIPPSLLHEEKASGTISSGDSPNSGRDPLTPSNEYNQCVFIRRLRIYKRAGSFPKVIKAGAGPHDLGPGHRRDEEGPFIPEQANNGIQDDGCNQDNVVILSDLPSAVDPLDPISEYIFENSEADIALVHDEDLAHIFEMKPPGSSEETTRSGLLKISPKISIGYNGGLSVARLELPSKDFESGSPSAFRKIVDVHTGPTSYTGSVADIEYATDNDAGSSSKPHKPQVSKIRLSSLNHDKRRTPRIPATVDVLNDEAHKRGCAECRRLKLRCERKWPCQNCRKRGCAEICPDGTFIKGTRSTKNERLVLHETIGKMSSRISQLEGAIETLQSVISTQPHPLLQDKDEQNTHPILNTWPKKVSQPADEDFLEALGAFYIGNKGETTFHEASAISEASYLLIGPDLNKSPTMQHSFRRQSTASSTLPPDLIILSGLFPFPPDSITTSLNDFSPHLPSFSQALFLIETYFENGAWSIDPVHQEDFIQRVLMECYPEKLPSIRRMSADRLSVLFMVFAIGTFFDLNKSLIPPEAEDYHTLARAALCVRPVYDYPTVYAVQSMTLIMWFQTLAGHRTQSYRPLLWGVLHTVCELMNLNIDPKKLRIEGVEAKVRQVAYWEMKSTEQWQAFTSGRPAIISVVDDCKQPYEEAYLNPEAHEADPAVWFGWKQHFTDVVNAVADQAFRTKDATYSRIMTLDKQLRHHHTPAPLRWPTTKGTMHQKLRRTTLTGMQCLARLILQESSLLHLHRWFFMQAVRERPFDPLDHQFAHSVRTVYQSASKILMSLQTMYGYHPVLVSRCKTAWTNAFSAALSIGTLVVSAPTIPLARPAMLEFERTCMLFQNTAMSSVQPDNAAFILMDLLKVAKQAVEQGRPLIATPDNTAWENERSDWANQSPLSVDSQRSWPSNSPSGTHATNNVDETHEYSPATVTENIHQWWESAAPDY